MTFDQTFKATIEILKASLLPLLTTINKVMNVTIKPLADLATKGFGGAVTAGGILLAAAGAWKGISFLLSRAAENFIRGGAAKTGGGLGGLGGGLGKNVGKEGEAVAE